MCKSALFAFSRFTAPAAITVPPVILRRTSRGSSPAAMAGSARPSSNSHRASSLPTTVVVRPFSKTGK